MLLSHADLLTRAARAAGGLRAAGIGRGDVVALRLGTGPEAAAVLVALWHLQAVAAPLSTRLPTASVPAALQMLGARALIASAPVPEADVPLLDPAALLATSPAALPPWQMLDLDAPATLVFTSGSSGLPKAAQHTLGNHVWNARGSNANIALLPRHRWLLTLPLYHVGGLGILFRTLEAGADLAFGWGDAPTHVSLVATQLHRLLEQESGVPDGLEAILLGGSAIPPALLDAALRRGLPVHTSYGLTEMASQVATTPPGAPREVLHSSGRLLPHREVRLTADSEIQVRGKTRFEGYRTAEVVRTPFDADGWYATGDLGYFDSGGLLHVTGRRDFLFISGGENIQPEEIERALAACGVVQSIVVPVPDAEFGQRPVAFVSPEALAYVEALRKSLEALLPRFKIPVAFLPLPPQHGMKPNRQALAREAAEGVG